MRIYGSSVLILINAGLLFLITFCKISSAVPPLFSKILSSTQRNFTGNDSISYELINFD